MNPTRSDFLGESTTYIKTLASSMKSSSDIAPSRMVFMATFVFSSK